MDSSTVTTQREELAHCLAEAAAQGGVDREACARLQNKLAKGHFNLVVAGAFKRGKSTVINALLGAELLPVGVIPVTSVVTLLKYGPAPKAAVGFVTGEEREVPLAQIAQYATERANPGNIKGVSEVTVAHPSEWLRGGTRLVDTPGIGSVHQHNTDVAYRFLPQADAVLFVAAADQPIGRAELDFLSHIRQYAGKVFCLLNKADYLSADQLTESAAHAVREALGGAVPVLPVSARLALEGGSNRSPELLERSGFPDLQRRLKRFLDEEKEEVWLVTLANHLLHILSQTRLTNELEARSLTAPLENLEANRRAFARKKTGNPPGQIRL